MRARLDLGRCLGCTLAFGSVAVDNLPMRRVCEVHGLKEAPNIPGYYTDQEPPRDGAIVVGVLGGATS